MYTEAGWMRNILPSYLSSCALTLTLFLKPKLLMSRSLPSSCESTREEESQAVKEKLS
jgi:hypothetical protein